MQVAIISSIYYFVSFFFISSSCVFLALQELLSYLKVKQKEKQLHPFLTLHKFQLVSNYFSPEMQARHQYTFVPITFLTYSYPNYLSNSSPNPCPNPCCNPSHNPCPNLCPNPWQCPNPNSYPDCLPNMCIFSSLSIQFLSNSLSLFLSKALS